MAATPRTPEPLEPCDAELQIMIPHRGLYRFAPAEVTAQLEEWAERGWDLERVRRHLVDHYGAEEGDYDDVTSLLTLAIVRVQH